MAGCSVTVGSQSSPLCRWLTGNKLVLLMRTFDKDWRGYRGQQMSRDIPIQGDERIRGMSTVESGQAGLIILAYEDLSPSPAATCAALAVVMSSSTGGLACARARDQEWLPLPQHKVPC